MTKTLGQVDPTGNYGLKPEEAEKTRAWAKKKAAEINANPDIPRRHRPAGPKPAKSIPNKPPGRACVVCEARFIRIVPVGTPPLCASHLKAWEGGGLPIVRQMIADGGLVSHPHLGMVLAKPVTKSPRHEKSVTKKKGRPKKQQTLSDAERARAYRERKQKD